ncbi:MAG: metallophosphoesterase family protein [Candidatus Tectimicrobiota bacterium]
MRLGILGDIHGYLPGSSTMCIEYAVHLTTALKVEAFLQVGDMCHYRSFARPVYWIYGNNDWPDVVRQIATGERPIQHLHHIGNGRVLTLRSGTEAVRIAGLNGAFEELYYELSPAAARPVESLAYFTRDDVERCLPLRQIDIFLVHGCPAGLGYGREPDHGVPAIREILDVVQPRLMFCGHAHLYRTAQSGQSTVYALNQLKDAYYILDTTTWQLEAFPSGSLP